MALIVCTECGKEVSDKAECCPNCGKPVAGSSISEMKTTTVEGVKISSIVLCAGGVIATVSAFLPYVYQILYVNNSTFKYNLFKAISKESGGASDTNFVFQIFPYLILLLSLVSAGIGLYEIKNRVKFENKTVKKVSSIVNVILLLVFEFIGMATYKETTKGLIDGLNELLSSGSIGTYGYGIGFYGLFIGIISCAGAVIAEQKLDGMKVI